MRKRKRLVLCSAGLLAVVAAIFLATQSGRTADRLVGSWEGEGTIGLVRTSAKATFNRDGTLTLFMRTEGGDMIPYSDEVPDPQKPGNVGRWRVGRTEGDVAVLRIIDPDQPHFPDLRITFRGDDEFAMTPMDSSPPDLEWVVFRRLR
jgi:hypothetical protein